MAQVPEAINDLKADRAYNMKDLPKVNAYLKILEYDHHSPCSFIITDIFSSFKGLCILVQKNEDHLHFYSSPDQESHRKEH